MTPHDPHGAHSRWRVIDAEPVNDNSSRRATPGFKLGVLVGLLIGVWVGFLARLAWFWLS